VVKHTIVADPSIHHTQPLLSPGLLTREISAWGEIFACHEKISFWIEIQGWQ